MDDPSAPRPDALENIPDGYDFSQDINSTAIDFNDYLIDYSHEEASGTSVREDEIRVDPPSDQNGHYVNSLSSDWPGQMFDEVGE